MKVKVLNEVYHEMTLAVIKILTYIKITSIHSHIQSTVFDRHKLLVQMIDGLSTESSQLLLFNEKGQRERELRDRSQQVGRYWFRLVKMAAK